MDSYKAIASVLAIALALTAPANWSATAMTWMSEREILESFRNVTLEGRYASGRPFSESYLPDGRVAYAEGAAMIGGRWSVTSGTLCTIYDIDPTGGCFRVARVSENCFEFYFASRTEEAAPGLDEDRLSWTARGSIRGRSARCDEGASV